jgi:hypothetical protein
LILVSDFETALEYAKKGYEATGDERLKEKIDMIKSGNTCAEIIAKGKFKVINQLPYKLAFLPVQAYNEASV